MTISLTISDGTTTVTLSGTSPVLGCTYFPETAQRSGGVYQPVTESAEVNLRGTAAAIRATVSSIERLLQLAAQRQDTGAGDRVYVNYAPVSETTYRSEVLDGRVVWSTDPGLRRLGDANPTVRIAVIWTRAPGWDGAEVELELSANGQAAATGGRSAYNNPANLNWVQIAAAQVAGNMPAPIRIQLTNSVGSSKTFRKVFLSVNANSDPANLVYYLQAEARSSGGTVTGDATCSGSSRLDFTVTSSPTTFTWTLPLAGMQRTKGRRARILARFSDAVGPLYVKPQIHDYNSGAVIWTGDEVSLGGLAYESWQDLGVVPLPPGGYASTYGAALLGLVFRGACIVELDALQLTMIDSYRYLEIPSIAVANTGAIVHDGIEGIAYMLTSGVKFPLATTFGGALMLEPNTLQRIHVLHQISAAGTAGAGDAPIANYLDVRVFHRPRRLTV